MTARRTIGVALLASTLLVAGCGSSDDDAGSDPTTATTEEQEEPTGADPAEVEALITESQRAKTPDLDVSEATCPDEVDPAGGTSFECTLTIEGVEARYTVEITGDPSSDDGQFHVAPTNAILSRDKVIDAIRANLEDGAAGIEVDCGPAKVRVEEVGAVFQCTLSDGTDSQVVDITVQDRDGKIDIAAG